MPKTLLSLPSEVQIEALKAENETLAALLKAALARLGKIAFNAETEEQAIDMSFDDLLRDF